MIRRSMPGLRPDYQAGAARQIERAPLQTIIAPRSRRKRQRNLNPKAA